jgi:DedD protein
MADPVADNADFAVDELKRKARRRLVGAIVIALAAATILPLVLEQDQKPLGDDVSVQIPAVDNGKFISRLKGDKGKDAPPAAKAEGGPIKAAADSSAAMPVPEPAGSTTATAGTPGSASGSATNAAEGGSPTARDNRSDTRVAAPEAKPAAPEAKAETKGAAKPAPKADAKSHPGAETAARARDAKPEPKAALAPAATTAPAAPASPSPSPADAAPAAEVAMASPAPAAPSASEAPAMPAPPAVSPAVERSREGYVVQLGAFTDNYGANALANKLKKAGYPAYTEPVETSRGTLWRVRVGGYPSRPAAIGARNKLKGDGHDGVVTAAK